MEKPAARLIRFGIYEADLRSGELRRDGSKLKVQDQPFQVLVALLERRGEMISRDELRARLWPSDTFVDFDHGLNTAINKLRDALGDTASNPRFIETIPRRGYRFIAPLDFVADQQAPESAGQAASAAIETEEDLPSIPRNLARFLFGLLQLMYLIFYTLALWRLQRIGDRIEDQGIPAVFVETTILVSAVIGIPTRLYTLSATLFDYKQLGAKFVRIFPLVLVLDILWALSPFLIAHEITVGLAFAACVALLYSPFSQRVLMLSAYPRNRN